MKKMEYNRLPNGNVTNDLDLYLKSWKDIVVAFETKFSVEVIGFGDRYLSFKDKGDGMMTYNKSAQLPMWFVNRILEK